MLTRLSTNELSHSRRTVCGSLLVSSLSLISETCRRGRAETQFKQCSQMLLVLNKRNFFLFQLLFLCYKAENTCCVEKIIQKIDPMNTGHEAG